eukprot:CAMPEP_0119310268 /NCGR_PEP_ID=MMETSP1333-20130426/18491_1 /TAXON_ID=418940 /ORGANISM="Scyphosphaera apsteinii, Strain RCC1455" /LENGTH=257 /DNA_ID=CAMNT_0007314423 /DNA_START=43 /DNA_END=816 /DNA_ORIENTATION=+
MAKKRCATLSTVMSTPRRVSACQASWAWRDCGPAKRRQRAACNSDAGVCNDDVACVALRLRGMPSLHHTHQIENHTDGCEEAHEAFEKTIHRVASLGLEDLSPWLDELPRHSHHLRNEGMLVLPACLEDMGSIHDGMSFLPANPEDALDAFNLSPGQACQCQSPDNCESTSFDASMAFETFARNLLGYGGLVSSDWAELEEQLNAERQIADQMLIVKDAVSVQSCLLSHVSLSLSPGDKSGTRPISSREDGVQVAWG